MFYLEYLNKISRTFFFLAEIEERCGGGYGCNSRGWTMRIHGGSDGAQILWCCDGRGAQIHLVMVGRREGEGAMGWCGWGLGKI